MLKLLPLLSVLFISPDAVLYGYRQDNPDVVEYCVENFEEGNVHISLSDHDYIEVPCKIWLDPQTLEEYLSYCKEDGRSCLRRGI